MLSDYATYHHVINGTKLLNVAGIIRGRRDGILKSEKMRHIDRANAFEGCLVSHENSTLRSEDNLTAVGDALRASP
jgi:hypothetical protein